MSLTSLYEIPNNFLEFELPQRSFTNSSEPRMSLQALKTITRFVTNIVNLSLAGIPPRLHKQVFSNSSREALINGAKQKYIATWSYMQFLIWLTWLKFKLRRLIIRSKKDYNNSFEVLITKRSNLKVKIEVLELPVTWKEFLHN